MEEKSKISIKQVLSDYIKSLKGLRVYFFLMVLCVIIANILENIIPYFYKIFFNYLESGGLKSEIANNLINVIIIIAIIHFFSWFFNRSAFFLLIPTESTGIAQLKQNSFSYLIKHSHGFFANSFTGSLVQKINRHGRAFERIIDTLIFNFLPLFLTTLGAIIVTFFTSKLLALIIFLWVSVYTICSIIFYRWRMKYNIEMAKADSETTGLLADNISNNQSILLFNSYEKEINSYNEATIKQVKIETKTWNLAGYYDSFQLLLIYVAEFFIFYFSIRYWQVDKITVGGIVMIQIYVVSLAKQIWYINMILRNIFESMADSRQMLEILTTPHEIFDSNTASGLIVKKGEIDFKAVTFNFNETRDVLTNINCKIQAGEKVALIGPSGAGKTTFIRLLLRLYNLTSGEILIDGQNISNITQESLRQNISLVPQDPVLFHRSLMENIRYGKPEATDEEVFQASKLAYCDEFIDSLPNKYDTLVGERGIKLSGGERQRIAIARAILKKAPILILDEATSSLDSNSEKLIQDALDNLMKDCTTIVIAHRLSTIRKMDRILVMSDGKIIEEGNHADLINKESGLYKDLWELQAGGFIQK